MSKAVGTARSLVSVRNIALRLVIHVDRTTDDANGPWPNSDSCTQSRTRARRYPRCASTIPICAP
jgi:hypothetical protein